MEEKKSTQKSTVLFLGFFGFLIFLFLLNFFMLGIWKKSGYLAKFSNCQAGRIASVSADSLKLEEKGKTFTVKIGEATEIRKGQSLGSANDLVVGKYVLVANDKASPEEIRPAGVIRVFGGGFSAFAAEKFKSLLRLF